MFIPILKKDATLNDEIKKFKEEVDEVINFTDEENLKEELLDVIQMSLGMLYKVCNKDTLKMKTALKQHNIKLLSRGWEIEKIVEVKLFNFREGK